jgi:HAD superfamily hydrolase (TIGR01509 family)
MSINKNIELVIFDMDGVLVDACEIHRISLNQALLETASYEIPIHEHYQTYNGIPTKKKLLILHDKGIIQKKDFFVIEKLKQHYTNELIIQKLSKRQEKIDLLHYLKSNNVKLACYTNSIRNTAQLMLEKTGIVNYFDLILSNEEVENPKPDPEGYIKIINYFNVDKTNTIIVEDSPKGYEAAYLSGCKVFRVLNEEHVNIELFRGFI